MRVMVVGASGVVGPRLVPGLITAGHEVIATTRTPAKTGAITAVGARAEVLDLLDAEAVATAVRTHRPDVIIHQATALVGAFDLKHLDRYFAATNRLRIEGTDNLLAAVRGDDRTRLVVQGFTGWAVEPTGSGPISEGDRLDRAVPAGARQTMAALAHVDRVVAAHGDGLGTVLRYGMFYGPGTALGRGGEMVDLVARRRLPVVGGGQGQWSFVHIDDAVAATIAAVDRPVHGVFNVVDDEPARVAEWLPGLAAAVGAAEPRSVPGWLARPLIGPLGVALMTRARGASNAKAGRELAWRPRYPSWREGFTAGLG
jgi:2-alkyl-3-oxoalkanoate reductase